MSISEMKIEQKGVKMRSRVSKRDKISELLADLAEFGHDYPLWGRKILKARLKL
jgi:hypothetical protein